MLRLTKTFRAEPSGEERLAGKKEISETYEVFIDVFDVVAVLEIKDGSIVEMSTGNKYLVDQKAATISRMIQSQRETPWEEPDDEHTCRQDAPTTLEPVGEADG